MDTVVQRRDGARRLRNYDDDDDDDDGRANRVEVRLILDDRERRRCSVLQVLRVVAARQLSLASLQGR